MKWKLFNRTPKAHILRIENIPEGKQLGTYKIIGKSFVIIDLVDKK